MKDKYSQKKLWVITGALGGLGKAVCTECAMRKIDLVITDLSQSRLDAYSQFLSSAYDIQAMGIAADLADPLSRQNFWSKLREQNIQINGIFNIAGLDHEGAFCERSSAEITELIRVNIEAVLDMTCSALAMRTKDRFNVINVSSLAAMQPMPLKAMYAASKRFLLDFSLALKEELRNQNAAVTVLCPAGMPTNAECVESIKSQGFAGALTTVDVGRVAYVTVNAALRGKTVVKPGFINRVIAVLTALLPPSTVAKIVHYRWSHTREIVKNKTI